MACKLTSRGGIKPCTGLSAVLETGGIGTRLQGAKLQTLVNMTTGKFSRQWVVIKSGKYQKTGIVANFCPFCGGQIFKEKAKKNETARARSALGGSNAE